MDDNSLQGRLTVLLRRQALLTREIAEVERQIHESKGELNSETVTCTDCKRPLTPGNGVRSSRGWMCAICRVRHTELQRTERK